MLLKDSAAGARFMQQIWGILANDSLDNEDLVIILTARLGQLANTGGAEVKAMVLKQLRGWVLSLMTDEQKHGTEN